MRAFALRSAVAAALCAACSLAAAQKVEKVVRAPHYGDTLFHFYQDRWFDAIVGGMVSAHFNRLSPHDDEAEVLRGGMLLSYGLHREAVSAPSAASSLRMRPDDTSASGSSE